MSYKEFKSFLAAFVSGKDVEKRRAVNVSSTTPVDVTTMPVNDPKAKGSLKKFADFVKNSLT